MNTKSRPDLLVLVVIVDRRRRDSLAQSLRTLKQQKYANFEGIVLDGSTDRSVDLLRASGPVRLQPIDHRPAGGLGAYREQRFFRIEKSHCRPAAKLFPKRLLIWNLLRFSLRAPVTFAAARLGCGESASVVSSAGSFRLLSCVIRASWAAFTKLPAMRERKHPIESFPRLSPAEGAGTFGWFQIPWRGLVLGAR